MNLKSSEICDDDDDDINFFDDEPVHQNYPNKTPTTVFCSNNVGDKSKMTSSQECELTSEPNEKFEKTENFDESDTLSDEDGKESNLFQQRTRSQSKKEEMAPEEIEKEFIGQVNVAHKIT